METDHNIVRKQDSSDGVIKRTNFPAASEDDKARCTCVYTDPPTLKRKE